MTENPRHMSESSEWYSPAEVVDRARAVLGAIHLDPFSCAEAQRVVRAEEHWTLAGARSGGKNGYLDEYVLCGAAVVGGSGRPVRVFVNPPGGTVDDRGMPMPVTRRGSRPCGETGSCGLPAPHSHVGRHSAQKLAWRKLVAEWLAGRVEQGVFLCFSLELLQTTQSGAGGGDLLPLDFPLCYPKKRLAYRRATAAGSEVGAAPPHASCVAYLPPRVAWPVPGRGAGQREVDAYLHVSRFRETFADLGRVVVPR